MQLELLLWTFLSRHIINHLNVFIVMFSLILIDSRLVENRESIEEFSIRVFFRLISHLVIVSEDREVGFVWVLLNPI